MGLAGWFPMIALVATLLLWGRPAARRDPDKAIA